MMILDKVARDRRSPKADNPLDIAGYAACLAECRDSAEPISGEVGDEWTERAYALLASMEDLVREARGVAPLDRLARLDEEVGL
jgi:hypothetical protein